MKGLKQHKRGISIKLKLILAAVILTAFFTLFEAASSSARQEMPLIPAVFEENLSQEGRAFIKEPAVETASERCVSEHIDEHVYGALIVRCDGPAGRVVMMTNM